MSQNTKRCGTETTADLTVSITLDGQLKDGHIDDKEGKLTLYETDDATSYTNIRNYINRLLVKNKKTPSV